MKHAFLMNCHRDIEQTLLTTALLQKYWLRDSQLYLYLDGPEYRDEEIGQLQKNGAKILRSKYEKRKSISLINALNRLVKEAISQEVTLATFLHSDMIPIFPATFQGFLQRFYESGKLLTYTPIVPGWLEMEFTNLHFRLDHLLAEDCFPLTAREQFDNKKFGSNEYHLTRSLCKSHPRWTEESYPMSMISLPIALNEGKDAEGAFVFRNYVPESSIIHTSDPWFWQNYAALSCFQRRDYPKELL